MAKTKTHTDQGWITDWLNYCEGDPTPEDLFMTEAQIAADEAIPIEMDEVSGLKIDYDPFAGLEAPPPLIDGEAALVCRSELRRFADSWIEAHYKIASWTLRNELETALGKRKPVIVGTVPPALYWESAPLFNYEPKDGYWHAVWFFFRFITSPLFDRLARCKRCEKYYIARRKQVQRFYCSKKCGGNETAKSTMRQRRAMEHETRLAACNKALQWFMQLPSKQRLKIGKKWKREVAAQATKNLPKILRYRLAVKAAFVTRAANRGKLILPSGLGG